MRVAGWVHRRRDHGGLVFVDLRDRTGIVQVVFNPETAPDAHARSHELRSEWVISVQRRGRSSIRGDGQPRHADGRGRGAGRRSSTCWRAPRRLPFPIDEDTPVDEALRLRHRYLDLRREPMQRALELRHRVTQAIRDHLNAAGFLDIETPILTRSTPEGARDFVVPGAHAARHLLRAAAVAAALQAAADDRGLRALLPDRALLPRRGAARRPPARVHAARHGDGVRARRRT